MYVIWLLLLLLQVTYGVQVWVTTLDQSYLLSRLGDLNPTNGNSNNANKITINSQTYQEIYGFGAALTESSAINFNTMKQKSSSSYLKTLNSLFDPTQGAGFQLLRIPIGSSDFSISPYFTYDDVTNDWLFDKWSWGRDSTYILPVLKDILKINPNIKIVLSPWSAPTWMKTSANQSNAFNWGSLGNDYFDDFAYYFQFTIQKYKSEGINIYALTLQNEPQNEPSSYPVMRLSAANESFLAKTLGPKLRSNNINTKILVWDHNWDDYQYPITVLRDSSAYQYIAGTAFHCYAGAVSSQNNVYSAYPDKEIWFTECSGTGANNFRSNIPWNTNNLYFGALKNWSRTVIHWNIALDEKAGPKASGGCTNCRGVITVNSDYVSVRYNEEYYGMAQISKFLRLPAHRLDCSLQGGNGCISTLCLRNSDNSVVTVVANFCSSSESIAIQNGGSYVQANVLVGLTTFVW